MKIYLASSWRNESYTTVLAQLRGNGHTVYDFRTQSAAFSWSDIESYWPLWDKGHTSLTDLESVFSIDKCIGGFHGDMTALAVADTCVLLLPCGASAHLEAGWAKGAGKRLYILSLAAIEAELMYLMSDGMYDTVDGLLRALKPDDDVKYTDRRPSL